MNETANIVTNHNTVPASDVLFVEVPAGGFTAEQIQRYVRAGYLCWGTVALVDASKTTGLILPEGAEHPQSDHLVLKKDVNAVPVNLLAHHLVKARNDKGGLNQVAETFFGLTIGGLERTLKEAQERANAR